MFGFDLADTEDEVCLLLETSLCSGPEVSWAPCVIGMLYHAEQESLHQGLHKTTGPELRKVFGLHLFTLQKVSAHRRRSRPGLQSEAC